MNVSSGSMHSTSRSAGHGKENVLKSLLDNDELCHVMETLGENVKPVGC